MRPNMVVVGSSGHAKVVIDVIEKQGAWRIAGLLDATRQVGEATLGYGVLGTEEDLPGLAEQHQLSGFLVAIGDNFTRGRVYQRIRDRVPALLPVSAVHPGAAIGAHATIHPGAVVMAGATVNPSAVAGEGTIINTNASLDHDSVMDSFSSLAPRVAVGGNCRIGSYSAISIGAVVKHGITIGARTVVGAGAVVLQDIGDNLVAYGVPARPVRTRADGERYL